MKIKSITISRGQHLSDVYSIESNTILCKTLTGLGATYSEIKADRDSIIIEPNQPAIIGKCKSAVHKKDNLLGVMQKVTTEDVVEYLERTIEEKKYIKILSTPESFYKVKEAFEELEENPYVRCFMLLDECQKYVQDNDYREDITLPIEDFFRFDNKAMVSATPIIPSDPRFEEQGFSLVQILPDYEYRKDISIIHTNNVLEALKVTIPQMLKAQTELRSICFFINSTDMIYQLIQKLGIEKDSAVFCATKSVDKLKRKGFKCAYENWDKAHMRQYNFFTSRFYTALNMELGEKPDVIFVTEPYFSEYTAIDPATDVVQSIGRFRNGTSTNTHVGNTHICMIIRKPQDIPISCLELTINNHIGMTKRTIIYQRAKDVATSCVHPLLTAFSNHPNLLARDTYPNTKLQKIFEIDIKLSPKIRIHHYTNSICLAVCRICMR